MHLYTRVLLLDQGVVEHYVNISSSLAHTTYNKSWTYIHNEEVQPTPGVGEILDETVGDPFQQHLQDKDVGENPVGVLQNDPDGLSLLDVHILKGLWRETHISQGEKPQEKYYTS